MATHLIPSFSYIHSTDFSVSFNVSNLFFESVQIKMLGLKLGDVKENLQK